MFVSLNQLRDMKQPEKLTAFTPKLIITDQPHTQLSVRDKNEIMFFVLIKIKDRVKYETVQLTKLNEL